jgi:hypothetical protein
MSLCRFGSGLVLIVGLSSCDYGTLEPIPLFDSSASVEPRVTAVRVGESATVTVRLTYTGFTRVSFLASSLPLRAASLSDPSCGPVSSCQFGLLADASAVDVLPGEHTRSVTVRVTGRQPGTVRVEVELFTPGSCDHNGVVCRGGNSLTREVTVEVLP